MYLTCDLTEARLHLTDFHGRWGERYFVSKATAQGLGHIFHRPPRRGADDEVYTDGSKWTREWGQRRSSTAISRMMRQPATNFPKDCQTIAPSLQLRLQHQSGTELLPTHGPSPSRCSGYSDSMSCLQAIEGEDTREPFDLPYHEPALVEWQRHTCSFLLDTKPLWYWGKWKEWTN